MEMVAEFADEREVRVEAVLLEQSPEASKVRDWFVGLVVLVAARDCAGFTSDFGKGSWRGGNEAAWNVMCPVMRNIHGVETSGNACFGEG